MRTRAVNWFNIKDHVVLHGIEVFDTADKMWKYYAEDGTPQLFKTEEERDLKRKEVRKIK